MSERRKAETKRYFVRLSDEAKKRLDFLAVDAGAVSTEAFGGEILDKAIAELWQRFDPKRRHADELKPRK